jgi:hypothetical protein
MKLLKIKNKELLKMGVDFDIIDGSYLFKSCIIQEEINGDCTLECTYICKIEDCYKSRPLIEIDGLCEFDVIKDGNTLLLFGENNRYNSHFSYISLGSIFLPENQKKYPEILKSAMQKLLKTNLMNEKTKIEKPIEDLLSAIEQLEEEIDEEEENIDSLEREINYSKNNIDELKAEIDELKAEIHE